MNLMKTKKLPPVFPFEPAGRKKRQLLRPGFYPPDWSTLPDDTHQGKNVTPSGLTPSHEIFALRLHKTRQNGLERSKAISARFPDYSEHLMPAVWLESWLHPISRDICLLMHRDGNPGPAEIKKKNFCYLQPEGDEVSSRVR
jgi:hypothetical protein